jgi:hypothetical protein
MGDAGATTSGNGVPPANPLNCYDHVHGQDPNRSAGMRHHIEFEYGRRSHPASFRARSCLPKLDRRPYLSAPAAEPSEAMPAT